MLQGYHLITITHRNAPLEAIGQFVPTNETVPALMGYLQQRFGWDESYCLTTCNRALFAFYTQQPVDDAAVRQALVSCLQPALSDEQVNTCQKYFQSFHGGDAVRHIFEVASSMDSLVVGEREIVRQLRAAYAQCQQWGLTGDHFRLLVAQAIEVSKQVFTTTGIGEKALSVVALAYQKMMESGVRPQQRIALVGAGDTNALMAKFLVKGGFHNVSVCNRTLAKAEQIAQQFANGTAYAFDTFGTAPLGFDAMVVCTAAAEPIVTPEKYSVLVGNDSTTKVLVDLAVPRNIATEVVENNPVQLIEIEGLRELAAEHLAFRELERKNAEAIINERLVQFRNIWHDRQVERSLHPMIEEIKAVKARTVEQVFAQEFGQMDADTKQLVLDMLDYMEKKCVAIPVRTIKEVAAKRAAGAPVGNH
jgi:glutamyl-tRNA reductase